MSDENSKNQDLYPDQNPGGEPGEVVENVDGLSEEQISEKRTKEDEELLSEVDSILNEEDPDFLSQLAQIKIDSETVNLSIMDQILGHNEESHTSLLNFLKRPFEFKTNMVQVLIFWGVFILALVAGKLALDHKGNLFSQNLFLNSFAEIGSDLRDFNPNVETESFYDNLRFAKNLVSISPMHVNLMASENSGNNPMLAIEIIAEGLSSDAIIEIKDREAEFKDMLLRLTEEKNYDELVESGGKQALCEQYRDILNAYLTRGQVRKVLLKSFVIKP